MVTPIKGDFASIPLTPAGRKLGNEWDPAKDEAAGEQCRSYGAPAIMRVPGRVHITWQDDNTLKVETDAGTQTRLFHFDGKPPEGAKPSWQGYSAANWERPVRGSGLPLAGLGAVREGTHGRSLEVVTTQLRPGYLRKNGAALQRQRGGERVLRSVEGTERRHLVPRDDDRERSAVSRGAVRYEYGFQEAARCRWVESFGVFGEVTDVLYV